MDLGRYNSGQELRAYSGRFGYVGGEEPNCWLLFYEGYEDETR
jgi:hypothetical protein